MRFDFRYELPSKWCPRHNKGAGQYIALGEFGVDSNKGSQGYCRECTREARRARYCRSGASLSDRWNTTRASALRRGLAFDLSLEEFKQITAQPCTYSLGNAIVRIGIDRKDNTQGYTMANSLPCCSRHNEIRSNVFTFEQMTDLCVRYGIECGNTRAGRKRKYADE